MTIDLNEMSKQELLKLQRDVEKAIANYGDREKQDALAKLEAHARELGFNLFALVGTSVTKTRKPAEAKYVNPEDPSMTWSGRGRKPLWFSAALANGMTPESLAI